VPLIHGNIPAKNDTVAVMLDQVSLHTITVFTISKPQAHNSLAEKKSLLMKNEKI
jgi:hypothetical protein